MDGRPLACALLMLGCLAHPGGLESAGPLSAAQPQPARERIAPFYTVHFDHVLPGRVAQFETARREFLRVLAAHRTHDARGTFMQAGPALFLTVKEFTAYADLDARRAERNRALAAVPPEAVQRYDDQSDVALDAPHKTEIWSHLEDLDYRAPGPTLSPFGAPSRMVVSTIRPRPDEPGCHEAWPRVRGALTAARYPLSHVAFYSGIGSGHVVEFWVAPSGDALAAAPQPEGAVAQILGERTAAELFACLDANVIHSESSDVVPRPDLTGE
jgi:hypothetical protein